jgi:protein-disulfide isomerase
MGRVRDALPAMTTASQRRARSRRRPDAVLPRRRREEPVRPPRSRTIALPLISAIALIGGALLIVMAVVGGGARPVEGPASKGASVAGSFSGLPASGYALGRADAPVTIDLYEDFQCPACRRWGETVFPALATNELADGRARLVFHDFAFIGPESMAAARAGQAAARQNRFWDLWAALYASQGPENGGTITASGLTALAGSLRMDTAKFAADMGSSGAGMAVDASIADGHRLGVDSTPTLVVGGRRLVGASYAELAAAIADASPR